jgi:hypothetical protein
MDVWSASRPYRFTPGERVAGIHWIGGWVGSRTGLDAVEERKILHCRESNPGRPLRCCTDWDMSTTSTTRQGSFICVYILLGWEFSRKHHNLLQLAWRCAILRCSLVITEIASQRFRHMARKPAAGPGSLYPSTEWRCSFVFRINLLYIIFF